jgi:DNA-binding MarR family transcriptional regulator
VQRDIQDATTLAIKKLDESFFQVRFDRLTPREKDYLRAMAELGSGHQRSGEISKSAGLTVQSVAPVRDSLIKKGMIYSPAHGDTAFAVSLFGNFLRRVTPVPAYCKTKENS